MFMPLKRVLCCKRARNYVVFDCSSTVDAGGGSLSLLPPSPTRSVTRIGVTPTEHACSLDPGPRLEMAMTAVRCRRNLVTLRKSGSLEQLPKSHNVTDPSKTFTNYEQSASFLESRPRYRYSGNFALLKRSPARTAGCMVLHNRWRGCWRQPV